MDTSENETFLTKKKFSEAIFTIAPKLVRMVRHSVFHKNVELECMILWKTGENGQVTNNIPTDLFRNLLKEIVKNQEGRIANQTDKTKEWPASEDKFYLKGKIRQRVIKTPQETFESEWIQKNSLEKRIFDVPQLRHGLCISLKKEKPLEENFIQKHNINKVTSIRKKQRYSIWWAKKPFRTDFTSIYSAKDPLQLVAESKDKKKAAVHQIETEFILDEKNLKLCQLSLEDFNRYYNLDSPFLEEREIREREFQIASDLLEISLLILNPEKTTSTLSLHSYPKSLYIG